MPDASGLDLLDESLSKVALLLSPEAEKYGLKFPKGMILWGPPGTGKSLSAKLAAKKMRVPLLAADWGSVVGSSRPDLALRELLELTQALSPTILSIGMILIKALQNGIPMQMAVFPGDYRGRF